MMATDTPIIFDIKNIRWLADEWGDYWVGELFQNGKRWALTGTYYSLDETGEKRLTREEQENELRNRLT